jgi:hypothetical protein
MRTGLHFIIAAVGLFGSTIAAAADAPSTTALPTQATNSTQTATWTRRTLLHFTHPPVIYSENGTWQEVSCDKLYEDVRFVLLQLGARASDMSVDQRGCYAFTRMRSVDVTFSVLAPADDTGKTPPGGLIQAQWKTVELKGDCSLLEYVTQKVLPLIPTKDAKYISLANCAKLGGIGVYAKVLVPAGPPEPVQ